MLKPVFKYEIKRQLVISVNIFNNFELVWGGRQKLDGWTSGLGGFNTEFLSRSKIRVMVKSQEVYT